MTDSPGQVRRATPSKMDVSSAIAAAWSRACLKVGKGRFADALHVDPKTVNRALIGETLPELHTAFAATQVDPNALDEVAKLFGFTLRPLCADPANDLDTVAGISHLAGRWIEALSDGKRDHRETCQLAEAIRVLIPALSAIVAEADRIKGAA